MIYNEVMIIILDNIRSLFNVGSIFRTADAAGIEKIYLCGITPTPTDRFGRIRPQLAKVSLGAENTVEWEYVKSVSGLMNKLKKQKIKIFAVEQDKGSIPYYKLKVESLKSKAESGNLKIALVFGNEVNGISKSILKRSDKILEIPMAGKKESLNVSVAAGIVIFNLKYGIK
ncbi:MAG: RNA methyltransferase [Patescibacteria group bacterium]|nr:RNA methyltransferase [Patescibacteria group bacterium]